MNNLKKAIIYPLMALSMFATNPYSASARNPEKEPKVFGYEATFDKNKNGVIDYPEDYIGLQKYGALLKPFHIEAGKPFFIKYNRKNVDMVIKKKGEKNKTLENKTEGTDSSLFEINEGKGKYNYALFTRGLKRPLIGSIIEE